MRGARDAPLTGRRAGDHRAGAGAGHLHAGAGFHHRQCLAAHHRRQSGRSPDQGTWVITAFAVANGIGVPLTGWLMGRYGVVRTFVFSVLAFTVASFLCGVAWSLPSLIFFRVLQGGVSGPMIPGSQALLISIFPPHKRGDRAGHLVDHHPGGADLRPDPGRLYLRQLSLGLDIPHQCAGRDCIVSLPVLGAISRPRDADPQAADRHGGAGASDRLGGRAAGDAGHRARTRTGSPRPRSSVLAIVTGIGFVAFLIWELTEKHPIVDLSLFKSRNFALGTLAFCLGYARVLRQQSADAALAADPDRLHRHLGGPGGGAHRRDRGAADADLPRG